MLWTIHLFATGPRLEQLFGLVTKALMLEIHPVERWSPVSYGDTQASPINSLKQH